jgi:hypothetical protein
VAIAWATIAILVLLLPGFMFFTGFYAPSRFSRDTTPRSTVGQLAAIVLVAFIVHVVLMWSTRVALLVFPKLPQVDLRLVLSALQAGTAGSASVNELSESLSEHWVVIPLYIGLSVIAGLGVGYGTAKGAVRGPFTFLLEHRWVYELTPPKGARAASTYAHVLTKIQDSGRIVMYRGPLHQFGLQNDGRFSYLVLRRAERFYLELGPEKPVTTATRAMVIGATRTKGDVERLAQSREIDFLYVAGQEISNVVFERFGFEAPGLSEAIKAIEQAQATESAASNSPAR